MAMARNGNTKTIIYNAHKNKHKHGLGNVYITGVVVAVQKQKGMEMVQVSKLANSYRY